MHASVDIHYTDNHDKYISALSDKLASLVMRPPTGAGPVAGNAHAGQPPSTGVISSASAIKNVPMCASTTLSIAKHSAAFSPFGQQARGAPPPCPPAAASAARFPLSFDANLISDNSRSSTCGSCCSSERSNSSTHSCNHNLISPVSIFRTSPAASAASHIHGLPALSNSMAKPAATTQLSLPSSGFPPVASTRAAPEQLRVQSEAVQADAGAALARPSLPLLTSGELSLEFEALMEADMADLVARDLIDWTPEQLVGDAVERVFGSCAGDGDGSAAAPSPPAAAAAEVTSSAARHAARKLQGESPCAAAGGRGGGAGGPRGGKRQLGRLLLCGMFGGCTGRNEDTM